MSRASIVVALASAFGALIAWRRLPSHRADQRGEPTMASV
jgi:hypothetical protein